MVLSVICRALRVIKRSTAIECAVCRDELAEKRHGAKDWNHEQRNEDEHVSLHCERTRSNEAKLNDDHRERESLEGKGF